MRFRWVSRDLGEVLSGQSLSHSGDSSIYAMRCDNGASNRYCICCNGLEYTHCNCTFFITGAVCLATARRNVCPTIEAVSPPQHACLPGARRPGASPDARRNVCPAIEAVSLPQHACLPLPSGGSKVGCIATLCCDAFFRSGDAMTRIRYAGEHIICLLVGCDAVHPRSFWLY
jgi:hypothetical protein